VIVVIKCQLKVKCHFVKKSSPSFAQGVIAKDMDIGEWHNGAKCKPNELYCMNEHNNEKRRKGEMKRTWVLFWIPYSKCFLPIIFNYEDQKWEWDASL